MATPKKKVTLTLGCTYAETAVALLHCDEDDLTEIRIMLLQQLDDIKEYVEELIAKGDKCVKTYQQITELLGHIRAYTNSAKGNIVQ